MAIVSAVAVVSLAACSGSSGNDAGASSDKTVSIDVGLDKPIEATTTKPRIAVFITGLATISARR